MSEAEHPAFDSFVNTVAALRAPDVLSITSTFERSIAERMSSCDILREVESASMRRIFACGKQRCKADSARCVPMPV